MPNPWFKFFGGDYLNDTKIENLTVAERSCWITILCLASQSNGSIEYYAENHILTRSGIDPISEDWRNAVGVTEKLEKLKMITLSNGIVTIVNWKKRQEASLTNAERQKKFRQRNGRNNKPVTKVTLDEEGDREVEGDKKKKNKASAASAARSPKEKKNPEEPLNLEKFVKSMRSSPSRYIRLIGEYADQIKPDLHTRGQWEVFVTRNVRVAKGLEPFTDSQIETAMTKLERNLKSKANPKGFITDWSLETLLKYLTK